MKRKGVRTKKVRTLRTKSSLQTSRQTSVTLMSVSCGNPAVFIGANAAGPNSCHWGTNDIVAFGAHNFVALYEPKVHMRNPNKHSRTLQKFQVVRTLPGHTGRVNVVRWIKKVTSTGGSEVEDELVSASSDKQIIVWKRQANANAPHEVRARVYVICE